MHVRQAPMPHKSVKRLQTAERLFDQGKFRQCIECCLRGLAAAPRHLEWRELLALAYLQAGESHLALQTYQDILSSHPDHFVAMLNTAKIHINQGRYSDAKPYLFWCEATGKMQEEIQYLLGLCFEAEKQYAQAIARFSDILEKNPKQAQSYVKLASCLAQLKHYKEAIELIDAARNILPESRELLFGKALLLKEQGLNAAALEAFEQLEKIKPENIEFICSHAEHLSAMMKIPESLDRYRHILKKEPNNVRAMIGYGVALTQLKRIDEAEVQFKRVLEIEPENMTALTNQSTLTMMRRDLKRAWAYSKLLFEKDKNFAGQYLYQMCFHCDWEHYDEAMQALKDDTDFSRSGAFVPIIFTDDPKTHLGYATRNAKSFQRQWVDILGPIKPRAREGKIRLGYYTCDFFAHATAILMEGLLKSHNRDLFELHAFSLDLRPTDEYNARIRNLFDHYHDVQNISDRAIAHMSRELGIDIAVDLKGYTEGSRTGIFAARAAPIQINFLGYPGSMGAEFIDYIVADHYLITPETRPYYTEKVIYMPHCYQPNNPSRPKPKPRAESPRPTELPEGKFVFCSFNNAYKITPDQFRLWMDILREAENSVLWLLSPPEDGKANLRREAEAQGIDPERIIFAPFLHEPEHLQRLTHADLFLDTFPCNAHTTASDALWAGVPVLTRSGGAFASRVAGSLLQTCGLLELVTENAQSYKTSAITLFSNNERLNKTRDKLINSVKNGPIYDISSFTQKFENGLLAIIEHQKHEAVTSDIEI